jgi:TetR/AcrR family transcriptional regulator, repressor of fatR-cypB operon
MRAEEQVQKGEKREAILQAALELVAENGLQHTPMSLISKRSGASAGIIYHYFESKDDLLASLYQRIKREMSRAIVAGDDPKQPLAKRFQSLWLSIFHYAFAHPKEMVFLEQYESIPGIKQHEGVKTLQDMAEIWREKHPFDSEDALEAQMLHGLVRDLSAQDLLKDLPLEVIGEFTTGVAVRLARQSAAGLVKLDEAALNNVARACWDAIAR